MHPSAYEAGRLLFKCYWRNEYRRILDIGSQDVNGSLRDFCPAGAEYIGIDIAEGKGVDLVLQDPYSFPFPDAHFDVIVSSSCFEHDRMFWLTFLEASRVLADGGILYINAPSNGTYHAYPRDNWRFYPDAGLALQEWAQRSGKNVRLVESFIATRVGPMAGESFWSDCVMVFSGGAPQPGGMGFTSDMLSASTLVRPVNIRRSGEPDIRAFREDSRDMEEIRALRRNLGILRQSYEGLSNAYAQVLAKSHSPPLCEGCVDSLLEDDAGRLLAGWAWDSRSQRPARFVVLLMDGLAVASAAVCLARTDVAAHLKTEQGGVGFAIPLPDLAGPIGPERCRVLAYADNYLGELTWGENWKRTQRE